MHLQNLESKIERLYYFFCINSKEINLDFGMVWFMLKTIHASLQRRDFDRQTNSSATYGPWTPRTLLATLDLSFNAPRKMPSTTLFRLSLDSNSFPSLSRILRRKFLSMNGTKSWTRKWRIWAIFREYWDIRLLFTVFFYFLLLLGLHIYSLRITGRLPEDTGKWCFGCRQSYSTCCILFYHWSTSM